ncbi:hypothetical protein GH714_017813 [Hevea brasiliensis]|uniref:R13L1/DRL21-like LRR repeat region domain-containing protein n=1 Tax=Hevea brasiliensis TaxID=3981 RepID=A0A6A6N2Y1_HEVBR|nr:hypothetical protein GH714_017813 [Hevea brasiliensis]
MKPHESLEKLTIIGYGGGFQVPSWVGDPLFRNLVCLKLENCNCTTLPQLGLLSSLKDLVIKGFPSVRAVDREFCWGSMSSSNPFPALETLRFEDMEEWKEWNICGCKFRLLRELSIVNCPEVFGELPSDLPSLQTLEIRECYGLVVSFQNLPSISHFQIQGCRKVELRGGFSAANLLMVSKVESFLFGSEELEQGLRKLKALTVGNHSNYESFTVGDLPVFDNNTSLESIEINSAPRLKSLPENLHMLTNLRRIFIYHCEGLEALPDGRVAHHSSEKIILESCGKLKALPDNMHNLTSLQELIIMNCPNVVSFPQGGLPTTHLKKIILESCGKLEALPDNMHNLTSLEVLAMQYCPGIMSFPEEGFPTNLKSLSIYEVEICTSLLNWGLHRLTSLEKLTIAGGCPGVVSFPQDEIDMKLSNSLTSLTIEGFQDLKYLSSKGFQSLTSLEYLVIKKCPKLASFPKMACLPLF